MCAVLAGLKFNKGVWEGVCEEHWGTHSSGLHTARAWSHTSRQGKSSVMTVEMMVPEGRHDLWPFCLQYQLRENLLTFFSDIKRVLCYIYVQVQVLIFFDSNQMYFVHLWLKREPPRCIWHYQYLSWPDHGVPNEPGGVLSFLEQVNRTQSAIPESGPIVVHCRYYAHLTQLLKIYSSL